MPAGSATGILSAALALSIASSSHPSSTAGPTDPNPPRTVEIQDRSAAEEAEMRRFRQCYERRAGRRPPIRTRDHERHWEIVNACLEEIRPPDVPAPYRPSWWDRSPAVIPLRARR